MFLRERVAVSLLVALAAALWAAPAASARMVPADGILSPRLAALARPGLSSAPEARQARAVGLPLEGPGSLQREGRRLLVEVRFGGSVGARLPELRAAGAEVLAVSSRYRTATVAVKPGELAGLRGLSGAVSAGEVLAPKVFAACPSGPSVSQGDAQLRTSAARGDFGLDGSGVTVGILSDSFDTATGTATTAAGDVAAGDLPGPGNPCGFSTPVGVLSDFAGGAGEEEEATDEGRAMAQIVHDLAPGAAIEFATAEGGEAVFAEHIRELAADGADVIVDDVSYFGEPDFQDGPVAVAIEEVTSKGVTYLTAAGNDNLFEGSKEIASWETPEFRDANECPPALEATSAKPDHCLDFDPGPGVDDTFGITVEPEELLLLEVQWAEPWFGVEADLDAYLLDADEEPLAEVEGDGAADNIDGESFELLGWKNKESTPVEVLLAIDRCFSSEKEREEKKGCNYKANPARKPRVKVILPENGQGVSATEYPESSGVDVVGPTVGGHAGSTSAIAVGAVRATGTPLGGGGKVEPYSSRGPVTHYFGPVTSSKEPAAALASPQVIQKPDVAASDCVSTSFFVPLKSVPGYFFCGTSAAAPHAAAVVALARQANPSASAAQLRADLAMTAKPVGSFSHDNVVGAGLLDAYDAIDELALPPKVSFPGSPTVTNSRQPPIAFGANRPATFTCSLDAGPAVPCESPFTPQQPLADGIHTLVVEALDLSGRTGRGSTTFTVDTKPPQTYFAGHPRHNVRTRRARVVLRFRFGSDSPGSRFVCRVDNGLFRFCPETLSRRFSPGAHAVQVKAVDPAGNVDSSPAVFRFRVRRLGR